METIDVFIQATGIDDIIVGSAVPEDSLHQVLSRLERPIPNREQLRIFVEDGPGPIDTETLVEEILPLRTPEELAGIPLRLHLARCRQVEVSVRFNAELAKKAFRPSTTIARVHHWAARRAFHLSPRDAAEHVLQLQGSNQRPDREVHIGSLVSGDECGVAFDLVPRKRVEG